MRAIKAYSCVWFVSSSLSKGRGRGAIYSLNMIRDRITETSLICLPKEKMLCRTIACLLSVVRPPSFFFKYSQHSSAQLRYMKPSEDSGLLLLRRILLLLTNSHARVQAA